MIALPHSTHQQSFAFLDDLFTTEHQFETTSAQLVPEDCRAQPGQEQGPYSVGGSFVSQVLRVAINNDPR